MKYLTSLYRDGLGRQPHLENLAFWSAEGERGVTRAKVLAAVAGSDEALEKLRVIAPDSDAFHDRWVADNATIGDLDRTTIRTDTARLPCCPCFGYSAPRKDGWDQWRSVFEQAFNLKQRFALARDVA